MAEKKKSWFSRLFGGKKEEEVNQTVDTQDVDTPDAIEENPSSDDTSETKAFVIQEERDSSTKVSEDNASSQHEKSSDVVAKTIVSGISEEIKESFHRDENADLTQHHEDTDQEDGNHASLKPQHHFLDNIARDAKEEIEAAHTQTVEDTVSEDTVSEDHISVKEVAAEEISLEYQSAGIESEVETEEIETEDETTKPDEVDENIDSTLDTASDNRAELLDKSHSNDSIPPEIVSPEIEPIKIESVEIESAAIEPVEIAPISKDDAQPSTSEAITSTDETTAVEEVASEPVISEQEKPEHRESEYIAAEAVEQEAVEQESIEPEPIEPESVEPESIKSEIVTPAVTTEETSKEIPAEVVADISEVTEEVVIEEEPKKKKGFFARLSSKLSKTRNNLTEGLADLFLGKKEISEEILEELETRLLMADVGIAVTDQMLTSIRDSVSRKSLSNVDELFAALKVQMKDILEPVSKPLVIGSDHKPYVILMIGVNGVGKTTTIGKLAKKFQAEGKSVMLAAGDTFRAAAVEQLEIWGDRNSIPVISQKEGADPASVIFDAMESAKARKVDILIADTAGRLHTDSGLMQELAKINRVIKRHDDTAPHEVMLVVDASTGQNALNQARQFNTTVPLSGITFTKLDGTAKGGIIFAIAEELNIPIRFIGVGETIDDLRVFNSDEFVDALIETKAQ